MSKIEIFEANHKDEFGKYFFRKAVSFALLKDFDNSYEFFKEGLDFLTCDCVSGGWRNEFKNSPEEIFVDLQNATAKKHAYYFVKAILLSYEEDNKNLYAALDSIDNYLKIFEDEYGLYVKGKIHLALKENKEALDLFKRASKLNISTRIQYRIGRTKEELTSEYGIDLLYTAFMSNNSSACCLRTLQKNHRKYKLEFEIQDQEKENTLCKTFLTLEDEWTFQGLYMVKQQNPNKVVERNEKNSFVILSFIDFLKNNENLFANDESEDEHYDDDYENDYDYEDSEPYMSGDPRYDSDENPWIDVFGEGDEAETAYWNTD